MSVMTRPIERRDERRDAADARDDRHARRPTPRRPGRCARRGRRRRRPSSRRGSGRETGVGPSIASGSQTCSGNCADLPDGAGEDAEREQRDDASAEARRVSASSWIAGDVERAGLASRSAGSPSRKPRSPRRVTRNAFFAAAAADSACGTRSRSAGRSRGRPAPRRRRSCRRLSTRTRPSIDAVNSDM